MPVSVAALDAVLQSVTAASNKWAVLLTGVPSAETAAAVHAVRFTGCAPTQVSTTVWGSPAGVLTRQRSNSSPVTFATVSGLGAAVTVSAWALVSTSDDAVPNAAATFGNVSTVWFTGEFLLPLSVSNGQQLRFAPGTLLVEVVGS